MIDYSLVDDQAGAALFWNSEVLQKQTQELQEQENVFVPIEDQIRFEVVKSEKSPSYVSIRATGEKRPTLYVGHLTIIPQEKE